MSLLRSLEGSRERWQGGRFLTRIGTMNRIEDEDEEEDEQRFMESVTLLCTRIGILTRKYMRACSRLGSRRYGRLEICATWKRFMESYRHGAPREMGCGTSVQSYTFFAI